MRLVVKADKTVHLETEDRHDAFSLGRIVDALHASGIGWCHSGDMSDNDYIRIEIFNAPPEDEDDA